jgi:hypothetical protein
VSGLREEIVNSAEQVFELLQLGEGTFLSLHFIFHQLQNWFHRLSLFLCCNQRTGILEGPT